MRLRRNAAAQPLQTMEQLLEKSRKLIGQEANDDSRHNSMHLTSKRIEKLKMKVLQVPKLHIEQLISEPERQSLPKLDVVVSYGAESILPEIVTICNQQQDSQLLQVENPQSPESPIRKMHTQPAERTRPKHGSKAHVLESCSKQDSYIQYKKKQLFRNSHRRVNTTSIVEPKEIQHLRRLIFPKIAQSSKHVPKSYEKPNYSLSTSHILDQSRLMMEDNSSMKQLLKQSELQEMRLKQIDKTLQEAIDNRFPSLNICKVMRLLNQSEETIIKEMEEDLVKEEKKEIYNKFSKIMDNEHMMFKSHLKHILDYKRNKIRDD